MTTIASLKPGLLDELVTELSTLASVYHKPTSVFLGQGRFAADEVQKAAIEEQQQNARENPIAAAAAAAAVSGATVAPQNNIENLLDIDFDGAAPASAQKPPSAGMSGLEGMAGTPQRVESPAPGAQTSGAANDLADIFGSSNGAASSQPGAQNIMGDDLMNGFASLSMGAGAGAKQPPPAQEQLEHDVWGGSSNGTQAAGSGAPKKEESLLDLM